MAERKDTRYRVPLGQVVLTRRVFLAVAFADIDVALVRHQAGDWGHVGEFTRQLNEAVLKTGGRLLSVYRDKRRTEFWIITEGDRSTTTVRLPEDY